MPNGIYKTTSASVEVFLGADIKTKVSVHSDGGGVLHIGDQNGYFLSIYTTAAKARMLALVVSAQDESPVLNTDSTGSEDDHA